MLKNKPNIQTNKRKSIESSKGINPKKAERVKREVKIHKTLEQLRDRKEDATINNLKE